MKRSQPEFRLHCVVADYLRATLAPDVLWMHVPNGEHRSPITGARLKRMGVRRGVADLMICWLNWDHLVPNQVLWIELKALKARQSSDQIEFARAAVMAGHAYGVAHSLAEVEGILLWHGVPTRGRIAA